mgnify:CR=1 FL=1
MQYTNINDIMSRLTKHPLLEDISLDIVVEYVVDFMRIVGVPTSFMDKTAVIDIHNYRGELPCDYYEMTQVRLLKKPCTPPELSSTFRYSTDSFHISPNKPRVSDLTYKIQGNCIFTSPLRDGPIEIAYKAIPVDEDGTPLIPDNSSYMRALQAFIKKEWFTVQFDQGKIDPRVMQKADQDYAFYVGQAQTSAIKPTIDQMESISNMWNTLVARSQDHRKGFLHTGSREHIRIH